MKINKKTGFTLIAGLLLAAGILGSAAFFLMCRPLAGEKAGTLYVDTDDAADSVFFKLETQLHARHLTGIRLLASCKDYGQQIHTGAYRFTPDERAWQIFNRLRGGHQTPVRLTIGSVRTLDRLAHNVSRQIMADSSSIARLLADTAYVSRLGYNTCTLPTLFIPNTYEVYWDMTAEEFIARMQKEHDRFWTPQRKALADSIGLTPAEVATLASIVDEETANTKEKPVVAGLYLNRLKVGMPLQADPTIKFSLQDFGLRRILYKHLEVESPYNTYKYAGLPPGPIRIASIQGMESVLNYARHDYLYMCAKEDFSGTHNFASTLAEHSRNAQRYQKALNRRNVH